VHAQSFEVKGFLEARGIDGADELAWRNGGLAKTRDGAGDDAFQGNGALAVSWQATPSLLASASGQYVSAMSPELDLLDAWIRYRPVSTTAWRWSGTAGMFFPPISLENDGVGWTSPYTLTPSAIDSWVGEELRVFGGEFRLEHRGEEATWDLRAAVFDHNDPAGELLATRGWGMGDLTSGLDTQVRQPDAYANAIGDPVPMLFRPFVKTDDRLGFYVGAGRETANGRARVLYYDNRTDPSSEIDYAGRDLYGWRTRFWSAGLEQRAGEWTFLGQLMTGTTRIAPDGAVYDTDFNAGYVLATRTFGDWQPAMRFDLFQIQQGEHGNGLTASLNWRPNERVRVIGEWVRIDSAQNLRALMGLDARQVDVQLQLAVRLYF
jgi:hypothetical protein